MPIFNVSANIPVANIQRHIVKLNIVSVSDCWILSEKFGMKSNSKLF